MRGEIAWTVERGFFGVAYGDSLFQYEMSLKPGRISNEQ